MKQTNFSFTIRTDEKSIDVDVDSVLLQHFRLWTEERCKLSEQLPGIKNRRYSEAVFTDLGNSVMLIISGQTVLNEKSEFVGKEDFEKQAVQVFENLKSILHKNRGTMSQILKTVIYVTDIKNLDVFRAVRKRYGVNPPAITLVQVSQLFREDLLIEIEATAVIPKL